MSESTETKTQDVKGRLKEAAGAVTDNEDLQESGRDDQRAAEAKSKVEKASDKIKDGIDDVRKKLGD